MVRLEDLPPKLREQALSQMNRTTPARKKDRRGDTRTVTDGVCWTCGERFTSTSKWEKHSDATGHRRFELIAERKAP